MSDQFEQDPEGLEEATDPNADSGEGGVFFQEKEEEENPQGFSWALLEAFEQTARQLHENEHLTDVIFEFDPPIPEFNITTAENALGRSLPHDIKSFYRMTNGFNLQWSLKMPDGSTAPGGHFQMFDFATVFGFWFDHIWVHDDTLNEDELDFIWSLRGISPRTAFENDYMTTLYLLGDWGQDYELFLHQPGKEVAQIHLDFVSYVYYGLETCGTYYWRHILSEFDVTTDDAARQGSRQFFETMSLAFPDVALEPYRALVPGLFDSTT